MSSTRVLLEAQAHHRRRALTAFLTADAHGPDEVLPRSGPLVGGVLIAVCLLVGALVTGLVAPTPPGGWDDGTVVVARGTGARLVALKGTLHPVLNTTSALLAQPAATGLSVQVADDARVASAPHGPALGIPGAPDELPPVAGLLPSGWMACLSGSQVRTTVSSRPSSARSTDLAVTALVRGGGAAVGHVLVSGHRFALPAGYEEPVSRFLGLSAPPLSVPQPWVDLFTAGTALDHRAFRFPSASPAGQLLPSGEAVAGRARRVGQLLVSSDHFGALSVVLADGTVPLTPFAGAVYRATSPHPLADPVAVTDAELVSTPISAARGFVPDDWPSHLPAPAAGALCARLDAAEGRAARTDLVIEEPDSPWVRAPGESAGTATGTATTTTVQAGHGALVRAGTTPGRGRVVLVDASGTAYPVTDPSRETLARLGYGAVRPPSVPPAWLALFRPGPDLSRQAVAGSGG